MKHFTGIIFGLVMGMMAHLQANPVASPINVTVSGGANVVAAPATDLGNFGDSTVLSWMIADILSYNGLNNTSLGSPVAVAGSIGQTSGAGGTSISLDVTGVDYLFLHWGGQHGGWAQLFYLNGASGNLTFDNSAIGSNPSVGGLSFYSFYTTTNVPDGGTTCLMLGTALFGLGLLRHRLVRVS
ncbi:MAG TPA: VPDSG-CTERM sorting domain-containing protein [Verrucomicrobiae bacterium]